MDWYKVYNGFWSNPKIKLIEKMPEGDTLICIFHKILDHLCASESITGELLLGGKPVTEKMLYILLDRPQLTIDLAINTFVELSMIEINSGFITVKNWPKYQTVDKMIDNRESNRLRQARFKERQRNKLLQSGENNGNALVTRYSRVDNATEKDLSSHVFNNKHEHEYKNNHVKKIEKKDFDLSGFSDSLKTAWSDFFEMRKSIKKPITAKGFILLKNELNRISTNENEQIRVINQSIMNNWAGLFPLKEQKNGGKGKRWDDGKVVYNELTTEELFGD